MLVFLDHLPICVSVFFNRSLDRVSTTLVTRKELRRAHSGNFAESAPKARKEQACRLSSRPQKPSRLSCLDHEF